MKNCVYAIALVLGVLLGGPVAAQQMSNEAEFIERVKEAVIRDLRESGALSEEVQKGIEAYIAKRRQAQESARAAQQRRAADLAKNVRRPDPERDHIFGASDALVSIIEYSDFECPYCKRFHPTVAEAVEAYAGKVNWVYRHFPLSFHNPGAQKQAEASECVAELKGNDAFWSFTDAIYERTKAGGNGFPLAALRPLAEEVGVDGAAFLECLNSDRMAKKVQEDMAEGTQVGISGTPGSIIINNKTGEVAVASGAWPLDRLKATIDSLIN